MSNAIAVWMGYAASIDHSFESHKVYGMLWKMLIRGDLIPIHGTGNLCVESADFYILTIAQLIRSWPFAWRMLRNIEVPTNQAATLVQE
jgi:hypothetical protein